MGGYFAAVSKEDCVFDLFFGVDYHSHLGTRRAGMAVYDPENGFDKAIHNIENAPFRTKFTKESQEMHGTMGIGCISDFEAQPILVRSHHGTFAITTVGKINNADAIVDEIIGTNAHFFEMHNGEINPTELVAALIDQKENFVEGIRYAQDVIDGSMSMLLLTPKGVYAARDKLGRTPIALGKKSDGYCASFESFAYLNLGYTDDRELGPGEIVVLTPDGVQQLVAPGKKMMGVLRLSVLVLSRDQRGKNALPLRRAAGRPRQRQAGHCGWCAGLRHCPRHRLCQRLRNTVFSSFC